MIVSLVSTGSRHLVDAPYASLVKSHPLNFQLLSHTLTLNNMMYKQLPSLQLLLPQLRQYKYEGRMSLLWSPEHPSSVTHTNLNSSSFVALT